MTWGQGHREAIELALRFILKPKNGLESKRCCKQDLNGVFD